MGYPIYHSAYTAAQIEASIGKTPRIKAATRTWEVWDIATSAYVDTGVSIDTQLYIDPTLSISGYAADAKVTGVNIGDVKNAVRYSYTESPGYIDSDGSVHAAASPYYHMYTELIPVTSDNIYYIYDTRDSHAHWLRLSKYNASQEFIENQSINGGAYNIVTEGVIAIDPTVKYIRFSYYSYSNHKAVLMISSKMIDAMTQKAIDVGRAENAATKAELDRLKNFATVDFGTLTPGYIDSDGTIHAPTTYKEVTTDFFQVDFDSAYFAFWYTDGSSHAIRSDIVYYDDTKTTIVDRRAIMESSIAVNAKDGFIDTPYGAKYARIWYQTFTYGVMTLTGRAENKCNSRINETLYPMKYALNPSVKSIAHAGYSYYYPKNTMLAFKEARKAGFEYVESDVSWTSDGVPVMQHDNLINSTARNDDGTELSQDVSITEITYEQALTYDFGVWKGDEFAGQRIVRLQDFLTFCRKSGAKAYLDIKYANGGTDARIAAIVDLVKECGMEGRVTYVADVVDYDGNHPLEVVHEADPHARLGYAVTSVAQEKIDDILTLKGPGNEVFLDTATVGSAEIITMCIQSNIPLEMWTLNVQSQVRSLYPYISGVTSDRYVAGYEQYLYSLT